MAAVLPDRKLPLSALSASDRAGAAAATTPAASPVLPGSCPDDPATPLLEPEALQATRTAFRDPRTPQARALADGRGVRVAWIADGLDPGNPDFHYMHQVVDKALHPPVKHGKKHHEKQVENPTDVCAYHPVTGYGSTDDVTSSGTTADSTSTTP